MPYENALYYVPIICLFYFIISYNYTLERVFCAWAMYSVVDIAFNPVYKFAHIPKYVLQQKNTSLEIMSANIVTIHSSTSIIMFLCIIFFCKYYSSSKFMAFTCLGNSLFVTYNYFFSKEATGINNNTGIDATIIAVTCPFLMTFFKKEKWYYYLIFIIPVAAVFLSTSSVGIVGTSIALFFYFYSKFKKKIFLLIPIASIVFGVICLGQETLFSGNGRFEVYKWAMKWWYENANHWTGTGFGTFWVFGPYIQLITKQSTNIGYFTFIHSDWLKILFELGYVGLFLAICLYIKMLWNGRKDPVILAAVITLGATEVFQMLLCYPFSVVVAAMLWFLTEKENYLCYN